ncbi:hypothetical protein Chor_002366 [Crotalus horridus]
MVTLAQLFRQPANICSEGAGREGIRLSKATQKEDDQLVAAKTHRHKEAQRGRLIKMSEFQKDLGWSRASSEPSITYRSKTSKIIDTHCSHKVLGFSIIYLQERSAAKSVPFSLPSPPESKYLGIFAVPLLYHLSHLPNLLGFGSLMPSVISSLGCYLPISLLGEEKIRP